MQRFTLLFLIVFIQQVAAQIRITTKSFSVVETTNELPSCEQLEWSSNDTVWVVHQRYYSYPFFEGKRQAAILQMNTIIQSYLEFNDQKRLKQKYKVPNCPEDRPASTYVQYSVTCIDTNYVSLFLERDEEPYGYGTGFAHYCYPITLSTVTGKNVRLQEVIDEPARESIAAIVLLKLKAVQPALFEEGGEGNNPVLFQHESIVNSNFLITKQGLALFISLNFGGKINYEKVELAFDVIEKYITDKRLLATIAHMKKIR